MLKNQSQENKIEIVYKEDKGLDRKQHNDKGEINLVNACLQRRNGSEISVITIPGECCLQLES